IPSLNGGTAGNNGTNGNTGNTGNTTNSGTAGVSGQPPAGVDKDMQPFWDTFNAVQDEFYGRPVDQQKMIYGATKGMMQSLGDDVYTFLTPQDNQGAQSAMQG